MQKLYILGENIFFKEYRNGKEIWNTVVIDKYISRLMYIIKDSKKTIKRHHNQIRKRYLEDINNQNEKPMNVIYDLFDVPMPLVAPVEKRSSKWKSTFSETMEINPKRKNTTFRGSSQLKKMGCCGVAG